MSALTWGGRAMVDEIMEKYSADLTFSSREMMAQEIAETRKGVKDILALAKPYVDELVDDARTTQLQKIQKKDREAQRHDDHVRALERVAKGIVAGKEEPGERLGALTTFVVDHLANERKAERVGAFREVIGLCEVQKRIYRDGIDTATAADALAKLIETLLSLAERST